MPRRKNAVVLSEEERERLDGFISRGSASARELAHARMLLKADGGGKAPAARWPDTRIASALETHRSTARRVRGRLCAEGLDAALFRRPPKNTKPGRLDGGLEARLVALACPEPPGGGGGWPIRLLAERSVQLERGEGVSRELAGRTLKKAG